MKISYLSGISCATGGGSILCACGSAKPILGENHQNSNAHLQDLQKPDDAILREIEEWCATAPIEEVRSAFWGLPVESCRNSLTPDERSFIGGDSDA